jgi:hypothetical protein
LVLVSLLLFRSDQDPAAPGIHYLAYGDGRNLSGRLNIAAGPAVLEDAIVEQPLGIRTAEGLDDTPHCRLPIPGILDGNRTVRESQGNIAIRQVAALEIDRSEVHPQHDGRHGMTCLMDREIADIIRIVIPRFDPMGGPVA